MLGCPDRPLPDVFPVAYRLVAAPYTSVPLRSGPSVKAYDERPGIVSVVGHDLRHVRHAVKAERISPSHPRYVCFQHPHPGIAHLLYDVALQQRLHTCLGMQVALRPETYLHALGACVLAE